MFNLVAAGPTEPTTTLALVNWGALTADLRGAGILLVTIGALVVIARVLKGDIAGFAKIAMCGLLGIFVVGLFVVVSDPSKVKAISDWLFTAGS